MRNRISGFRNSVLLIRTRGLLLIQPGKPVAATLFALALGYGDPNDRDSLRHDYLWQTATDWAEELGSSELPPKKRTRNSRFIWCYRSNRVTLSAEPPGIFRFWACSGGDRPWAGGLPVGGHTRRLQGCIRARGASPQSSILRCNIETLG
jgi:hypothetical protein